MESQNGQNRLRIFLSSPEFIHPVENHFPNALFSDDTHKNETGSHFFSPRLLGSECYSFPSKAIRKHEKSFISYHPYLGF